MVGERPRDPRGLAWDGKRLAAKISGHTLQRIFTVVLLAVAAFMLIDAAL